MSKLKKESKEDLKVMLYYLMGGMGMFTLILLGVEWLSALFISVLVVTVLGGFTLYFFHLGIFALRDWYKEKVREKVLDEMYLEDIKNAV